MRALALLRLGLPLALLVAAPPAAASQVFPDAVKAAIPQMECAPTCLLCHPTMQGGIASNKFAISLKTVALAAGGGVVPRDTNSLRNALITLANTPSADADGDLVGDYAELLNNTDPNVANTSPTEPPLCETVPLYGCGASIAAAPVARPTDPTNAILTGLMAVMSVLVMRRRRR